MKILLLGNGGREHTFAWKIRQSRHCGPLFIAPGNAGTASLGQNVAIAVNDFEAIRDFVLQEDIHLIIVGPEVPLVDGIYDFFQQDELLKHRIVFGPSKAAAQLEGSKDFAKDFMQKFGIPTASYRSFVQGELSEGLEYIKQHPLPVVLKADGLAAGKGVLICETHAQAEAEFEKMLGGKFGAASQKVVVEAFLKGLEFSVFTITNGTSYKVFPVAKDYKRIGEGDTGLNTGGMGSISPVPFVDEVMMEKVITRIIEPTIKGIQEEQLHYHGFIFFGLIEVGGEPMVIEYNCRMGDPETQVVLPRLKNDLIDLILATHQGLLEDIEIESDPRTAAAVISVSGGYPAAYEKGKVIQGIAQVNEAMVLQAGTKKEGDQIVTNGGRVIAVTAFGNNIKEAVDLAIKQTQKISFEGRYFRKDIGFDLFD